MALSIPMIWKKRFVKKISKWTSFERREAQSSEYHQQLVNQGDEVEAEVWTNNLYEVLLRRHKNEGLCDLIHLAIRTLDRQAKHDWRHFQRIKNELLGEDIEAVEVYPAEERLVDTMNQYHLWAFDDPNFRFPFGYKNRLVTEGNKGLARQRPFQIGFKPADCQRLDEI